MITKKKATALVDEALQRQCGRNDAIITTIRSENKRLLSEQKDQLKADYVKRLDIAVDKVRFEERQFVESGNGTDIFISEPEDYIYADICAEAESKKYGAAIKAISEAQGKSAEIIESVEKTVAQVTYGRNKGWSDIGAPGLDPERMLSSGRRQALQTACVKVSLKDPHGRSIVKNIRRFTIGRGIKYTCPVEAIQEVLDEFWKQNKMEKRQKDMAEDKFVESEYFMLFFRNLSTGKDGGTTRFRKIRTAEITEIETNPEDVETVLAYKREFTKGDQLVTRWYPDVNYYDLPDEPGNTSAYESKFAQGAAEGSVVMYFLKDGPADELRGRPAMESILPWLKHFETICVDSVRRWHEMCKVIWFKKVAGRGTEATTRERRFPKGGVIIPETSNVTYRSEAPKVAAGDAETLMTQTLYTVGAGVTVPLFMLHQDPSNSNYASIRKSDTPFSQMIVDIQDDWSIVFDKIFRVVIDTKIRVGKLSDRVELVTYTEEAQWQAMDMLISGVLNGDTVESLTEAIRPVLEEGVEKQQIMTIDVPIEIIFPDVVRESELDQAKTLEVWNKLGVSPQTIYSRMGLDWKQELAHQVALRKMQFDEDLERDEKRLANYEKGQGTATPEEE